MEEKTFNLLYEPWILVLNQAGQKEEVSLLTALEHANEFRCLAGELPTQDVAILRLLLATLYATFTRVEASGIRKPIGDAEEALTRWKSLWELKHLPIEPIKNRLCHYEERFYLFHPERPFYQVAGLHEATGKHNTIAQIVSDVPSRAERRFLTMKTGRNAETLSFAEATRWLVSMQAWDYAGKKAAVVDGTKDGGGTGWLGKIGIIYPASNSLFETLLLNFILLNSDGSLLPIGLPTWEEEQAPTPKKKERRPTGYCELLTWQSRRVRLFAEGDADSGLVNGVLYSYGDVFSTPDMFIEQMTGWHVSTQGDIRGHFVPNKHQEERSLWRDLNSILPQAASNNTTNNLNPGTVQWIALLKERKMISNDIVQLCAVGFHYGAMDAKVEAMTADTLTIHTGIFTQLGIEWILVVSNILQLTDKCTQNLFSLASDLAKASGDSDSLKHKAGEEVGVAAKAEAYFLLDMPFRTWLAVIDPMQTDITSAEQEWKDIMKRILLQLGKEITHRFGEKAVTGRWVNGRLYTAPGALAKYKSSIKRTIAKGG